MGDLHAFKVSVNGKPLCTAGIPGDGVLSVIIGWAGGPRRRPGGELDLHVGGLERASHQHVRWNVPELSVGDVVVVEVVRTDTVDPPPIRFSGTESAWDRRRRIFSNSMLSALARARSNPPRSIRDILNIIRGASTKD